jgi:hypothetical protein
VHCSKKKPEVELVDPSGELLTFYVDVTLPAKHHDAITSRDEMYEVIAKKKHLHTLAKTQLVAWSGGKLAV